MKVVAIIPAAGQGTRMGAAVPKQFLSLNGKPLLFHTLQAFSKSGAVDGVILVVPEAELAAAEATWPVEFPIVKRVVAGGAQRQDSVRNGFDALDADTDIVMTHDGVRPFVTGDLIRAVAEAAGKHGAALAAIPVSDTLKHADPDGVVTRTVDREGVWRIQTPQAFRYDTLKQAYDKAERDRYYGTDEGAIVEHLGQQVHIVRGSELNIKITQAEDLILAEAILAREKR